jgi:hypothetical protein
VDSFPLSECSEITRPGYLRRQDARAATAEISAFVRMAPAWGRPAAPFSSEGPALFCHPSLPFSHEFAETSHLHVGSVDAEP